MPRDYSNPKIKLVDCVHGGFYKLDSRNLRTGVFVAHKKGFTGIRTKFGHRFLDMEYHWDTGYPYGTANPLELICICPLPDGEVGHWIRHASALQAEDTTDDSDLKWLSNDELYAWIEEQNKHVKDDEDGEEEGCKEDGRDGNGEV